MQLASAMTLGNSRGQSLHDDRHSDLDDEARVSPIVKEGASRSKSSLDDIDSKSTKDADIPDSGLNGNNEVQFGVQRVQALIQVWPTEALIGTYIVIWITYFVLLMQANSLNVLSAFVTSSFGYHSLTPTITIVAQVVSGVVTVSIAKVIDIFGRPHGLGFGIIVNMLGMIMMAAARNIETTAAADVFWQVGYNALFYTIKCVQPCLRHMHVYSNSL